MRLPRRWPPAPRCRRGSTPSTGSRSRGSIRAAGLRPPGSGALVPITEPLVLPSDVTILPVARLATRLQARLKANAAGYAVTRPQGRSRAKLIDAAGAALLEEF